jgi:hypothetical protein
VEAVIAWHECIFTNTLEGSVLVGRVRSVISETRGDADVIASIKEDYSTGQKRERAKEK